MKFQDLKVGVEYAVIPAWSYSSQNKKNPDYVRRSDVARATLVSLDKFDYQVIRSDMENDPRFTLAPKGARSVGYLVKSDDWGQQTTYWLARPQDIVAQYDTLTSRWEKEEREAEERDRKIRAEHEARELRMNQAREKETRILTNVRESLNSIIGEQRTSTIRFDLDNKRNAEGDYLPTGVITLDSRTAQLLIEKVLEAKDLVG